MRLILAPGSFLAAPSLSAQVLPLPAPHAAAVVWMNGSPPTYPQDTVRVSTGAGTGTWVGAGIGAMIGSALEGDQHATTHRTCPRPREPSASQVRR